MPEPPPRSPENHLCFDFHGVRVALDGDAAVVEELARDFAWFRATQGPCGLALEVLRTTPERFHGRARAWPRTPRYRVADAGSWRTVLYRDGSRLVWDFAARRGTATSPEAWRLRELGYLTILSRVGEALEARGWNRVHALGLTLRGEAGLVLLPSGGGKSVLALAALRAEGWGLLSDDTPLIRSDGTVRAFPLRLSFLMDQDLSLIPRCRGGPSAAWAVPTRSWWTCPSSADACRAKRPCAGSPWARVGPAPKPPSSPARARGPWRSSATR